MPNKYMDIYNLLLISYVISTFVLISPVFKNTTCILQKFMLRKCCDIFIVYINC